jgi:hypothetical protein
MSEGCTILQACRKIAFNSKDDLTIPDKEFYLQQSDENRQKLDDALIVLEKILAYYANEDILKGTYYKTKAPTYICFDPKTMKLDLKTNSIYVDGEHEVYVILFDGDDENEKHYDPAYTNVKIEESVLARAKRILQKHQTRNKEAKKRGRKPKVELDDIEAFYRDNIDSFRDIKQEAVVASVLEHFPTIGKTTATIRVKECKEKILKEKFLSEINY